MTTDSEQRVRALLEAAAPEPPHTAVGTDIRRRASGGVVPLRRRSRATTLSVVLAAAAVIVVALTVVGLVLRSGNDKVAPPAGKHGSHSIASPRVGGPARCTDNATVFKGGAFVGPSGGDGTVTLTIHNRGTHACTFRDLPSIHLIAGHTVVSRLAASSYRPSRPVVIGERSSVRVVVALHAGGCAVVSRFTTRIKVVMDGFAYGFGAHIEGCGYTLASAAVRR